MKDQLLLYLPRLSDKRAARVLSCARENYAAQSKDEPHTVTERMLCAGILAELSDEHAHMVYVAAKTLHDQQGGEDAAQLREAIHRLADKINSASVLHRVYRILQRAYNTQ